MGTEKNNTEPVKLADEALEGVAGGICIAEEELDKIVIPLFLKGYTANDVYQQLVEDELIDEYVGYYITGANMNLGDYLNDRMDRYYKTVAPAKSVK